MDLTSVKTIRAVQDKFGFHFKKGYGQNFLTSGDIIEKIADAAEISGGALEIGPGFGVLTAELAERAEKVAALEIDERLIPVLEYTLSEYDNVKIINADVMKTDTASLIRDEFGDMEVSIAANLPYYITTPIITKLIEERLPVKNIVVMVQKEVAERLTAQPGGKEYGAISVFCNYYAETEMITKVPAGCFVPAPKVDSAVVRLRPRKTPAVSVKDEKIFFRTVKAAFAQRRKTLLNCLASAFSADKETLSELMRSAGIEPSRRGETLSLSEFAAISDKLTEFIG